MYTWVYGSVLSEINAKISGQNFKGKQDFA